MEEEPMVADGSSPSADEDIPMTDAAADGAAETEKTQEKKNGEGEGEEEASGNAARNAPSGVKVEDLFADMDSDDEEFPSSRVPANEEQAGTPEESTAACVNAATNYTARDTLLTWSQ